MMLNRTLQFLFFYVSMPFLATFCFGQEDEKHLKPRPVQLKDAAPAAEPAFRARVLDTRSNGDLHDFFMSDDGQFAICVEPHTEETARYALWNLGEGKLVRYLATKEGDGTKAYDGVVEATAVETVFAQRRVRRIALAPDGGFIAALTIYYDIGPEHQKPREEILVWESSTGKLIQRLITGTGHHPHTFFFVDSNNIVTKAHSPDGISLELIDVSTGVVDYLFKNVKTEMYARSVRKELIPYTASRSVFAINWKTKERVDYENAPSVPPGASSSGPRSSDTRHLWYSEDGGFLYARVGSHLLTWDAHSTRFLRRNRLGAENLLLVADEAGLVARRRPGKRTLELIDIETDNAVTTLMLPYHRVRLAGMSQDAKRLAVPTNDRKMLILDFPSASRIGVISIIDAAKHAKGMTLR